MTNRFTTSVLCLLLFTGAKGQYCTLSGQTPYSPQQPGITNFSLNTINRTSGNSESASAVLVVTGLSTTVTAGQTYTISITHSEDSQIFPGARNNLRVWVDYNKNFSFTDPGETVLLKDLEAPNSTYTATFTIPSTATGTLTLRATAKMSNDAGHTLPTPCNVPADPLGYHGEMEDYLLVIDGGIQGQAPQAQFATSAATLCTTSTLGVTNTSSGTPAPTFSWTASPSAGVTFTPSSSSQNPQVKFTAAGHYTLTCMATNSLGTNSASKTVTLVACSTVGTNEIADISSFSVFPNPASEKVSIVTGAPGRSVLVLTNSLGEVVLKKHLEKEKNDLDVSNLSAGLYYLRCTEGAEIINHQLLITR